MCICHAFLRYIRCLLSQQVSHRFSEGLPPLTNDRSASGNYRRVFDPERVAANDKRQQPGQVNRGQWDSARGENARKGKERSQGEVAVVALVRIFPARKARCVCKQFRQCRATRRLQQSQEFSSTTIVGQLIIACK